MIIPPVVRSGKEIIFASYGNRPDGPHVIHSPSAVIGVHVSRKIEAKKKKCWDKNKLAANVKEDRVTRIRAT